MKCWPCRPQSAWPLSGLFNRTMMRYLTDLLDFMSRHPAISLIRALLALALFLFIFGDFGLVTRIDMELENRRLEQRQAQEQQKIAALKSTITNAYLPDSVEKVARERYNFRRKGETVFIIREK